MALREMLSQWHHTPTTTPGAAPAPAVVQPTRNFAGKPVPTAGAPGSPDGAKSPMKSPMHHHGMIGKALKAGNHAMAMHHIGHLLRAVKASSLSQTPMQGSSLATDTDKDGY